MRCNIRYMVGGSAAGIITGLFGSGGGLILLPILSGRKNEHNHFPISVAIMLPICVLAYFFAANEVELRTVNLIPFFAGGILGGLISSKVSSMVPQRFLHLFFSGILIWGGFRFLCL